MKELLRRLLQFFTLEKAEINTVYFTIFLLLLLAMSLSHFYFWETPLFGIPLFFLIHAFGQACLEAGAFLLLGFLFNRLAPRWLFHAFIGFSFAILLVHFTDFTLIRLMDASISYMYKYFFGAGIQHIITAFQALNFNPLMISLVIMATLLIPFLGIILYRTTQPLTKLLAWKIPIPQLLLALIGIGCALFVLDIVFHPYMTRITYNKFQKALPLGTTFLSPTRQCTSLSHSIAPPRNELRTHQILQQKHLSAASKPNIYLFIIETFRKDFVTQETAPQLTAFGNENISFQESFANANSTHPSWFTIFHADFPYHWTAMRDTWKQGSIPLNILKNLGYKIRIYSSTDLRYFNMDQLLFGEHRQLADQIEEYTQNRLIEPCDRDALCIQSFLRDIDHPSNQEGNLFVFFFDSTHSEYGVPKDFPLKFLPIVDKIDYLTITPKEIEPVKNRYRNAIHYVDTLFGTFLAKLKEKNLYQDALIAVTGDHGEEFFEEGALFHGTHLNRYQTSVPIFYKLQNKNVQNDTATHLDLFPSILHQLTGRSDLKELFDGESIFQPNRWPYRIAVLQNGPETPCEFIVENTRSKIHCRFFDPKDIYGTAKLELLAPTHEADLLTILAPLLEPR
jgi:hypothetical protein